MKKIGLSVLSLICAVCMVFGVMMMANVTTTVSADAEVVLSTTAIKKSTNKDKMLLVTAVKNYEAVYEVGYTGIEDADKITCETNKYYSDITAGEKTWTAETIFGNEFAGAGLIVWEINYSVEKEYTFQAYASYGNIVQDGIEPVGTINGTERTVEAEKVGTKLPSEAFAILSNSANYSDSDYWWGRAVSVVNGDTVKAGAVVGAYYCGFTWTKSAIESLLALDVKTVSFDVTFDVATYLGVSIGSQTGFVSSANGTNVTDQYGDVAYMVAAGETLTLDLQATLNALTTAEKSDVMFFMFAGAEWKGSVASGAVDYAYLTNFTCEMKTVEEKAFEILSTSSNYEGSDYWWGTSVSAQGSNIRAGAVVGTSYCGFALTKTAIQSLIDLGLKTVSFDIALDNGTYLGVSVGTQEGFVSGDVEAFVANQYGSTKAYMIPAGGRVTLDLQATLNAINAVDTTNVKFWMFNGAEWSGTVADGNADWATLSNFTCEMKSAEEMAFEVLTTGSNYNGDAYAYGYAGSVAGVDDDIVINAVCPSGALAGFSIKREAIQALKDLGFKTFTFTVSLENENYCLDMYVSGPQTAYLTGEGFIAKGSNRNHYISHGGRVTADIDLLLQAIDANTTGAYVKFVVVNGADWVTTNSSTVVTLADIVFA